MKLILFLTLMVSAALQPSCTKVETRTQLEDAAFLVIKDAGENMVFQIDGGTPQPVQWWPEEVRYSISPGRRLLVISQEGRELVRRELYLSQGQVIEVSLPKQ